MSLRNSKWNLLLGVIFMGSIALGLLGRALCTRSWNDYDVIRPECRIPDVIETVLWEEDLDRLYVCYNDANRVNVYDGQGDFLWSVGTPWMRNSEFELLNGELVIFNGDAYRYDAADGSFLGLAKEEDLPIKHTTWIHRQSGDYRVGPYAFDSFRVFRVLPDGSRELVVARPWWYCAFLFPLWWAVAMLAALAFGLLFLLEKLRDHRSKTSQRGRTGTPVFFQSREARRLRNYYRAQALGQALIAVAIPIAAHFTPAAYLVGIFPTILHFIVSGWVLENKRNCLVCERAERSEVDFWHTLKSATMIAAFLAVAVSAVLYKG